MILAPSMPTIWTPRAGPWWRRPRWTDHLMAHLKKGAGGHLLKNPSGHLVNGGCVECEFCESTPSRLPVVFEGVTIGTGCRGIFSQTNVIGGDITGTWDIPFYTCTAWVNWRLDQDPSTAIEATYWSGSGCTGSSQTPLLRAGVRFYQYTLGVWKWEVRADLVVGTTNCGQVFYAGWDGTALDCRMNQVASNTLTESISNVGWGGTVEVNP